MFARAGAAISFGLVLLASASALAVDTVAIRGDEPGCPSPAQVLEALRAILPGVAAGEAPEAMDVQLLDEGRAHQVIAGGAARRFADPSRRCVERARKVALFIALRLGAESHAPATPDEPQVHDEPSPSSPTPVPEPASPPKAPVVAAEVAVPAVLTKPEPRPARGPAIELELAGLFASAPTAEAAMTGGAVARIFAGGRYVGAVLGVTGQGPVRLHGAPDARLLRIPVDLGVRGRLFLRQVLLALDFAFSLGAQQTQGIDLPGAITETRLEIGFTTRARVAYSVTRRLAPFVELGVTGLVTRYLLTVPDRSNPVADTPRLWVNVVAGLSVRLR